MTMNMSLGLKNQMLAGILGSMCPITTLNYERTD